jgi:putative ABC transport system permease protein
MRALLSRPWVLGPLLLARRPGVALAIASAAFVATLPAAAAAPFLSSARGATLHRQIDRTCQWDLGATLNTEIRVPPAGSFAGSDTGQFSSRRDFSSRTSEEARVSGAVDRLGPPVRSLLSGVVGNTSTRPEIPTKLTVLARDGFANNVSVEQGPSGQGVWLPNEYAEANRLKVGDTVTLEGSGKSAPSPVRVAAIYTDLRRAPTTPYWCSYETAYRGKPGSELDDPPPPLVLVDWDSMFALGDQQRLTMQLMTEHVVLDTGRLTQPEAARVGGQIEALRGRLLPEGNDFDPYHTSFRTALRHAADRAELVRHNMVGSVLPISGAGVLVGLLVVAASAIFWVQRRRRELTVLASHGVGAAALGAKAVVESAPALAIGAACGWAAAWALVRAVGPSPILSSEARPLALAAAGATLALAIAVVGIAAAVRCRTLTDQPGHHRTGRRRLAVLPWELVLLGAAYPAWLALDDRTEVATTTLGAVAQVPGRLLVVPIMVATGAVVLAARLGALLLRNRPKPGPTAPPQALTPWPRRTARAHTPRSPRALLSWRRLGREAATAAILAAAVAVPIALATYGAVLNASVRATLRAEAHFIIGADVVLTLAAPAPIPASLKERATEVLRLDGTMIDGIQTDILAVDPKTFGRDAFWDDRLSTRPMADMLRALHPPQSPDDPVRGFVSGIAPSGAQPVDWRGSPLLTADIDNVGRLPAPRSSYPVLLVHHDALGAGAEHATIQFWVHGDPDEISRAARDAKLPLSRIAIADNIFRDTVFEPVTYTFAYLSALSLFTGLIATVALLLYLEGRAPAHRRSYVLLRRMGLRRRTHFAALVAELSVPLVAGLLGGLAIAAALIMRLAPYFEVDPSLPPDTVLTLPAGTLVVIASAVVLVALLASAYGHQRVSRARPGEVLRDAQ